MIKEIKYAVQIVILNENGEVLAVSRKDNHEDMGLVGGKVDPEDETALDAIIRETKEETGLTIYKENIIEVFSMHRNGYMGITYLTNEFSGEITTDEPHIVKWYPFDVVINGSFGGWNELVSESLDSMGVEYRKHSHPNQIFFFHVNKIDGTIAITPKWFWEQEYCLSDNMIDSDRYLIKIMADKHGLQLDEVSESIFEIYQNKQSIHIDKIENLMLEAGFMKNNDFSLFLEKNYCL